MREDLTLGEMVHVGVEYPRPHEPLAIPDEHVSYGVSLFRQHIEHAIVLEGEVRGRDRIFFDSTRARSEEHTSELQSLMRISYAVFCLKKKKTKHIKIYKTQDKK